MADEGGQMVTNAGFEIVRVNTSDGLTLAMRVYAPHDPSATGRLPVVCLPGLTRNSRDFHSLATLIANDPLFARTVYSLDSRGRGQSDRDTDKSHYSLPVETADVIAACEQMNIGRALFIGTSRGGLILHLLAAIKGDLIAAAVLNDIGPVVGLEGLKHIQSYLCHPGPELKDREAAIARLQSIHGAQFPALNQTDWADMADAIYIRQGDVYTGDFDPAIANAMAALDLSKPGPTLWPQFELLAAKPLLTIRGHHSAILTQETLSDMARKAPAMRTCLAYGQGHAPLLHHASVYPAIQTFLNAQAQG